MSIYSSILSLKIKIKDIIGILPKCQILTFNKCILDNSQTFEYYKITNESNLDLTITSRKNAFDIYISTFSGKRVYVNVSGHEKKN